jgi:hypothetical protein
MADALAGFGRDDNNRLTGAIVSASRQITYPARLRWMLMALAARYAKGWP